MPDLLGYLKSSDRNVRARSATLLGALGDKAASALPALLEILNEPSPSNQARSMGGNPLPFPYPLELNPKSEAVRAIGMIAPKLGDPIARQVSVAFLVLLDDPNDEVRSQAIVTLGEFRSPLGPLASRLISKLESIHEKESNPYVKSEIEQAITSLNASKNLAEIAEPRGKR